MASERLQRQIDRLLDEAEQAIAQRDWPTVLERAQDVVAIDPGNSEGKAFLKAAKRSLESAPATPPGDPHPSTSESAPVATPSSFANGRYQVQRLLGEGGKKKVCLAHDTTLDREVAFALIKTEGLDDVSRTRIQREAQAMGRLGSHPHIVTVFDLGQEQDQPYMVTELMGGGDVEGLIENAEGHRLPLEQAISIAVETCRGLEFAHNRGIVHRDLKPGNVWITSDAIAKIGDFGLAVALDRSRLTSSGMMVGTVAYMPPEQAMGGEVTPRSDLYSLGAMLYEMVTGRPPFLGDDSVAIIGQHINTPPVGPTWHNHDCPRPLEALILRLLAKDPAERPASAGDVLAALEAVDLTQRSVSEQGSAPPQDDAHALDSLAGGVFVGRQREMGELKAALEGALSGRARMVTLVGEPGIGKTRTSQELATYAGLRQAQVIWGRCYEDQGAPSYWPWVQAIRAYARDRDADQLRADIGAGAADIAEIVSDIRDKLPGLPQPPALEPEQARFRLFDSITTFLKGAANRQPLVLVLEDLHWADQPSLLLLEFLARQMAASPIMLLGCYRDAELSRQHPLSETLARLSHEPVFQRQPLRRLSQEDTGLFIEAAVGKRPSQGLVDTVFDHTEGNPFFTSEVIRHLSESGELTDDEAFALPEIRIPEGVRDVIGQRLNRLSEDCNETLTVASAIGREFSLGLLKLLMNGLSEGRLLEVVDEGLAAGVIEELPDTVGGQRFSHALIQETLVDELPASRRAQLHGRIGEALEEMYGAAAELAYHFAEAQAVAGTEKLVQYSLLAGEHSLASYAYEDSLAHFERGLAARRIALSGNEAAPDEEAAALLFGLGRAQAATGDPHLIEQVAATLWRAFEYFAHAGIVSLVVAVAEHPVSIRGTEMGDLIDRALELVPPDSHEAGRLLSRHGRVLGRIGGQYEDAQEDFSRALNIARRDGDKTLELQTLAEAAGLAYTHLRHEESLQRSLSAIELARRIEDPRSEVPARFSAVGSNYTRDNLEEAVRHATAVLPLAEKLRDRNWLPPALWRNEIIPHLAGDWQTAREFSDRALAMSGLSSSFLSTRVLLEYENGEFGAGEAYVNRLLEAMRLVSPASHDYAFTTIVLTFVDRITGESKWTDASAEAAQRVIAVAPTPMAIISARTALGLVAVLRDDAESAEERYRYLQQYPGIVLPGILRSVDRLLGLLSQTMGNPEQAKAHFEDALAFCRKAGYRPELAWTCHDYAEMLMAVPVGARHAVPLRSEQVTGLLEEALAISTELGMRPLMEKVTVLTESLATQPPAPSPAFPDGLTAREVEVLGLIATGKTDREIGEELFISVNTVGNHVRSILNKTAAANRTEAAAYAAVRGLTGGGDPTAPD